MLQNVVATMPPKSRLRRFVDGARSVDQLEYILRQIPLQNIKGFIMAQINRIQLDTSIPISFISKSINDILPNEMIRSILSFDSNRIYAKQVCKQWNKLSGQLDIVELKSKYKILQYEIKHNKEETGLLEEVCLLEDTKRAILAKIDKEYEEDKKTIHIKYTEMIKGLRNLSNYKCGKCGNGGSDLVLVECDECQVSLCPVCRSECAMECGFYSCKECENRDHCIKCNKAVCEDCFGDDYDLSTSIPIPECDWCGGYLCPNCTEGCHYGTYGNFHKFIVQSG